MLHDMLCKSSLQDMLIHMLFMPKYAERNASIMDKGLLITSRRAWGFDYSSRRVGPGDMVST